MLLDPLNPDAGARRRAVAGCALVLLLALPASDALPSLQWNLHIGRRLRTEHKAIPDVARDALARQLIAFLPDTGQVGLVHFGPGSAEDRVRTRYLLQYSLAPRLIVETHDLPFVIVVGDGSARSPLRNDPQFALVRSVHDYLSVFRRIDR